MHCKVPQSTQGRVVDWEGRPLQMVCFGARGWHWRDCNKGQAEWKWREPTWDAAHCDHWVPRQSKRTASNDAEGREFFYTLERSSVLNQMFSATEFQSIGNDGPGSDSPSSSPENINMSRRNTCLHILVAVGEQSSGNHTHNFLVEKIFKSKQKNLIFKVKLFIKHERMSLARWCTPVSAAPQEEGQQVWLCLKIFLFIFSGAYMMYAFGLGAAMALEHKPTLGQRSAYVAFHFIFLKNQDQFLTESGAYHFN